MAATRETLVMVLAMTVMMGLAISAYFTVLETGLTAGFAHAWLRRFASTYVIVLPAVLVFAPVARRIAARVVRAPDRRRLADPSSDTRAVALEAWRRNGHGHGGASFEPWYAMLAEDVAITMPLGAFRGENRGIEAARGIYGAIARATPRLVYEEPIRVSVADATGAGATVVIEFHDHGTIAGRPYANRIAASFDIRDGKVAAYREYFGDIDPEVVALMHAHAEAAPMTDADSARGPSALARGAHP